MTFEGGPYIQAACFCEIALQDKESVLSLIRIIDTLNTNAAGPNPPEDMPPVTHMLKLVLMLKSGMARGRYNLKLVPQLPDGSTKDAKIMTVHFEGDEKGHNVIMNMAFTFEVEGLYWFNIYLDDDKLTAIPFRVKYNRVVTTSAIPR